MSTKTMKILTFIATLLLVVSLGTSAIFALSPNEIDGTNANVSTEDIIGLGNRLMSILQTVGIITSVIILVVLGIKYMMGSAEEKAEYKKTMMPYLIGAVLAFLAPTIANAIYKLVSVSK